MPESAFFLEKMEYPFLSGARYDAHDSSLKVQKGRLNASFLPRGNFFSFFNVRLCTNFQWIAFGLFINDTFSVGNAAMVEHAISPIKARAIVTWILKGLGIVEQLAHGRPHHIF